MTMGTIFGSSIVADGELPLDGYPMFYGLSYDIKHARIRDNRCIVIIPKDAIKLEQLQKVARTVEKNEKLPVIVVSESLTAFQRKGLNSAGIAWYASEELFSVPFLAVSSIQVPKLRPATLLSAGAQRLAVRILDGSWDGLTSSQVAALLGKSLPSVSNYFREIEAICPDSIASSGRTRFIHAPREISGSWLDLFRTYLTNPCKRRAYYALPDGEVPCQLDLPISGVTALSRYTMIADNHYRTFALHEAAGRMRVRVESLLPGAIEVFRHDSPDISLEWWSYEPWNIDGSVDLVSLYLVSEDLANRENDERLADAVHELRGAITGER